MEDKLFLAKLSAEDLIAQDTKSFTVHSFTS